MTHVPDEQLRDAVEMMAARPTTTTAARNLTRWEAAAEAVNRELIALETTVGDLPARIKAILGPEPEERMQRLPEEDRPRASDAVSYLWDIADRMNEQVAQLNEMVARIEI